MTSDPMKRLVDVLAVALGVVEVGLAAAEWVWQQVRP